MAYSRVMEGKDKQVYAPMPTPMVDELDRHAKARRYSRAQMLTFIAMDWLKVNRKDLAKREKAAAEWDKPK